VSHRTIDAVRTAHHILRNHEFYRVFKKSDLSSKHFLSGKNIEIIKCKGSYENLSSIIFKIDNTKLIYQYIDKDDLESETVLHQL
jgi:hypothetical protein